MIVLLLDVLTKSRKTMLKFLTKLFGGSKSEKDINELKPTVELINQYYKEYDALTNEQLAAKTEEFRAIIKERTLDLENEKVELKNKLINEELEADEIHGINDRLKQLEKDLFHEVQSALDELLPEAYATVKQVCKRLTEQKHVYTYAGQTSTWAMIPFDVQLIGAIVIHQGKISEMQTGEGKTLVSIMPLYLNSLAGKGVHLVTVNDYLARRDCEWMKPVFDYLGITVGSIQSNMDSEERFEIYRRDITYGTNNEFGFDYLRDNMVTDLSELVQREHWFAVVDEVDSVLIDEARTPLIISGPVGKADHKFDEMNPRVKRLVDAQSKLVNQIVADAVKISDNASKEEKDKLGMLLLRSYRGMPRHKRLAKILQEPEMQKLKHKAEMFYLQDQGRKMSEVDEGLYYTIDEKSHQIDITEMGRELLCNDQEDPDLFVIPDIASEMSMIEGNTHLSPNEKQLQIDKVNALYADRSDRIHTVTSLLKAYSLYEKDIEYILQDDKVLIVDEHTGRVLDGRRYSEGLHQAIEAKENVKVERDTQTFATITLQNYFRLYHKLAGMTGTAETEAGEFDKIYKLDVVVIPTNRPITRKDQNDVIYKTKREKYNAIMEETRALTNEGRAVLIGTASVEVSEILDKMFTRAGIKHNVLNAKNHAKEAEIVANAGKSGSVTIATNMAGRGTDIKIDEIARKSGGLAIIGSERHDARRIDRQLRGRSGRQGDPGSSKFFISLEDNLIRLFGQGGERIATVMEKLNIPEGEAIEHSMVTKSVERAQKKVEENNFGIRKRLLDYDDVMNQQREVIYARRRHALQGDRLKGEIFEYLENMAYNWYEDYHANPSDIDELSDVVRSTILCDLGLDRNKFSNMNADQFVQHLMGIAEEFYKRKEEILGIEFLKQLEKVAVLQTIDDKWREHLREMDELKEGIYLRSYGQKDPLLEYKGEAYKLFVSMVEEIDKECVHFIFKFFPQIVEREVVARDREQQKIAREQASGAAPVLKNSTITQGLRFEHSDVTPVYLEENKRPSPAMRQEMAQEESSKPKIETYVHQDQKVGRNDTVKVRYMDGTVKEAKLKKVQADIDAGKCYIL